MGLLFKIIINSLFSTIIFQLFKCIWYLKEIPTTQSLTLMIYVYMFCIPLPWQHKCIKPKLHTSLGFPPDLLLSLS